jgi:hypothetical protein
MAGAGGHFSETEIAQSMWKEFPSTGGIELGTAGGVKDRWQVII